MAEKFSNSAQTTLQTAINTTSRPVTVTVADASKFPTSGQFRILIDSELMLVNSVSGNDFSATNVEGTSATSHSAGTPVIHILTAGSLIDVIDQKVAVVDAEINSHVPLPDAHHARSHTVTNTLDHAFPGGTAVFLRGDGTWSAPPAVAAARYENIFDVTDYGALGGTTNDTSAIQNAVDAAAAAGGGGVFLPYLHQINASIKLKKGVVLFSTGPYGGGLQAKGSWSPANGTPMVTTYDDNTPQCGVRDMRIDGNGRHVTGVAFINNNSVKTSWDGQPDPIHFGRGLMIRNCYDGIGSDGDQGRAQRFMDIRIYNAERYGLNVSIADSFWTDIDIGSSGSHGVFVDGANNYFKGIKSWYSDGDGFNVNKPRNNFASCCAQDNLQNGWNLVSGDNNYAACDADSNNNLGGTSGPNANYAGWRIQGNGNMISACSSYDKNEGGVTKQRYGIDWIGSVTKIDLSMRIYGNLAGNEHGAPGSTSATRIFIVS